MLDAETKRKLRELKAASMVEACDIVTTDAAYRALPFEDKMRVVVDFAYQRMREDRVTYLLRNAHLRLPQADVVDIDYEGRPIRRELILELATTQFVERSTDLILEGFTGTGKSHLACALGKQACKHGLRTLYVRMPDMLALRDEKIRTGWPERRVINKYASYKVLILDEFLIDEPTKEQTRFLLELTERRYNTASTIFCSQYATDEWHRRMGGGTHAESVMDRKCEASHLRSNAKSYVMRSSSGLGRVSWAGTPANFA